MYTYKLKEHVEKMFFKLTKKNPTQIYIIEKKINEIRKNPHRYKNLRSPLNHLKRVHIDTSFVLTFSIDEENKKVIFES